MTNAKQIKEMAIKAYELAAALEALDLKNEDHQDAIVQSLFDASGDLESLAEQEAKA